MKLRTIKTFTGAKFRVPERIQRIDTRNTHGWQLRYGRGKTATEMFSDFSNDGSGSEAALLRAIAALRKRINKLPAPNRLRSEPIASKSNNLPVGISGPTERNAGKPGKTPYFCFQVSVPLPSGGSTTKSVYIGTANTRSKQREKAALAKATGIRDAAVEKFEVARTKAKRDDAAKSLRP